MFDRSFDCGHAEQYGVTPVACDGTTNGAESALSMVGAMRGAALSEAA